MPDLITKAPAAPPARPPFHAYPHADRMTYRDVIENAGGEVADYNGAFVAVAVPIHRGAFYQACHDGGLEVMGASWYFPLGTDAPPAHLRHDGRYPGSAGFWLFANLRPINPPSGPSDY